MPFRMEFNNLQLGNKTLLYVQQGKCPPINIHKIFLLHVNTCYIHDIVWI